MNSSVLKWPNAEAVDRAVRRWAQEIAHKRPEIIRIGYFGSYARGDWGVGSDLDLIVVVEQPQLPPIERACEWDVTELPVPVDLVIYTENEWESLAERGRFGKMLRQETVWVYERKLSTGE
ncbi:MAG: nucleotidyltransferase domain-containing protein [Candidatus Hadarchaeum sp.]